MNSIQRKASLKVYKNHEALGILIELKDSRYLTTYMNHLCDFSYALLSHT